MTEAGNLRRAVAAPVRTLAELASRLFCQWWPHLLALAASCGIVAATIAGALGVGDALDVRVFSIALISICCAKRDVIFACTIFGI